MLAEPIEKTGEVIHFCGQRHRRSDRAYRVSSLRLNHLLGVCFTIGAVAFVVVGAFGAGKTAAAVLAGGLGFLPLLIAAVLGTYAERAFERFTCDGQTHGARLACVNPRDAFTGTGQLTDVPFEPQVLRSSFVMGYRIAHWVVPMACAAAFSILHFIAGPNLVVGKAMARPAYFLGYMMMSTLAGFYVMDWLSPTYLRIVPGRVEVMEFGVFLRGRAKVTSYLLRTAKVVVDLRQLAVFVDDEKKNVHGELAIAFVRDTDRLAYYLLLAAISTHEPAPLPDDSLLG